MSAEDLDTEVDNDGLPQQAEPWPKAVAEALSYRDTSTGNDARKRRHHELYCAAITASMIGNPEMPLLDRIRQAHQVADHALAFAEWREALSGYPSAPRAERIG